MDNGPKTKAPSATPSKAGGTITEKPLKFSLSAAREQRKNIKRVSLQREDVSEERELSHPTKKRFAAPYQEPQRSDHDSNEPKTAKSAQLVAPSLDDYLEKLNDSPHATAGKMVSEEDVEETGDISESASSQNRTRERTRARPGLKLDSIVAEHSSVPFERQLYDQNISEKGIEAAEEFKLKKKITVEGSDLLPILDWRNAMLPLPVLKVIESSGYHEPTPVQAQCLPLIMNGLDLEAIAPTGSGKTAAFTIPMWRHLVANMSAHREMSKGPYALVLAPTRELCIQIFKELKPFTSALHLHAVNAYGGSDISTQISEIVNGRCDIIVATPGRLIDLLTANRGRILSLRGVTYLVVDETDRMFDLGFGPQVRKIVESCRPDRQTVVFSATMSSAIASLVARILTNPVRVTVGLTSTVPPQVTQEAIIIAEEADRFQELLSRLREERERDAEARILIFVDTQVRADALALRLIAKSVPCQSLHGGMDQQDRSHTIEEFKHGNLRVLVATSVAARGLDVRNLKLVINYDPASHLEDYVHRAGRTGRAGNSGSCVTFLTAANKRQAYDLASLFTVPKPVQDLADAYAKSIPPTHAKSGFGGHGLSRLEKKRDLQRNVEQEAYSGSKMSTPQAEPSIISKIGRNYVARLPINDAPREARIAVTSVSKQNEVIANHQVSITIKGTYNSHPKGGVNEEHKLHLQVEGPRQDHVEAAYFELARTLEDVSSTAKATGRYSVI